MADVRGTSPIPITANPLTHGGSSAGNLKSLNELAKVARADYIIHTGDFGFYDESSLDRIADKYASYLQRYSHWHWLIGFIGL